MKAVVAVDIHGLRSALSEKAKGFVAEALPYRRYPLATWQVRQSGMPKRV